MEEQIKCIHWECPYKCCIWHENYSEDAYKSMSWDQESRNPMTCTFHLDR